MAIEKVNFHYPKKSIQSVYSHIEMSALELAAATAGKVDECVEMVNGVEQSAIEARQIVDTMRNDQDNFILENDDARAQIIVNNQGFIDNLTLEKDTFIGGLTEEKNTFIDELTTSKNTFEENITTNYNNYVDDILTAKETFTNQMTNEVNIIVSNSELTIKNDVNEKIDTLINNGTISNILNDELLSDINTKLVAIEALTVNLKDFGAIGDGINDDTAAFQSLAAFVRNKSNLNIEIPSGSYILSQNIVFTVSNTVINFNGSIKLKSGIVCPYGLITVIGQNIELNNMNIDGNNLNAIDEAAFGISGLFTIGEQCKNVIINNSIFKNTKYCAVFSNGNSSDIIYNNPTFENIGEQCFYISGGKNKNYTFNNVKVTDFGMYQNRGQGAAANHHSYVIRSRGDLYGNNDNFIINGLTVKTTIKSMNAESIVECGYLDNLTLINVNTINQYNEIDLLNVTASPTTLDVKIKDCVAHNVTYGVPANPINIEIYNSRLETRPLDLLVISKAVNTIFNVVGLGGSIQLIAPKAKGVQYVFDGCTFTFENDNCSFYINHDLGKDIIFKGCVFRGGQTNIPAFFINSGVNIQNHILFDNCYCYNAVGYLIADNQVNPNLLLTIINSHAKTPLTRLTNSNSTMLKLINCNDVKQVGITTERPLSTNISKGFNYYDTTINKSIWWTGTNWVDAVGVIS